MTHEEIYKIAPYVEEHSKRCWVEGYIACLQALNSPKDPNKDLEEAVEKHINEALYKWFYDDEDGVEQYVYDAFIAGAEWQKEQMLKDAKDG